MKKIIKGTLSHIESELNKIDGDVNVQYQEIGDDEYIATVTIYESSTKNKCNKDKCDCSSSDENLNQSNDLDELNENNINMINDMLDSLINTNITGGILSSDEFTNIKDFVKIVRSNLNIPEDEFKNGLEQYMELVGIPKELIDALFDQKDSLLEHGKEQDLKANEIKRDIALKIADSNNMNYNDTKKIVFEYYEKLANIKNTKDLRDLINSNEHNMIMTAAKELGYDTEFDVDPDEVKTFNIVLYPTFEQVELIKEKRREEQLTKEINNYFDKFDE